jgi:hypothetical protein
MDSNAVALAVVALATALCTGFFKLVASQNKTHQKIADGLDRLAKAHETGNRESAERNGHLGEQNVHLAELTKETSKQIIRAISKIKQQNVAEQKVEHQTVKEKN